VTPDFSQLLERECVTLTLTTTSMPINLTTRPIFG
jgi:hypothetical protein